MEFVTNVSEFENDLRELVRLFDSNSEFDKVSVIAEKTEKFYLSKVYINDELIINKSMQRIYLDDQLLDKRYFKRLIKVALYEAFTKKYNVVLPWGALTGVRPTKLAYEYINNGVSYMNTEYYLNKDFHIDKKKTKILIDIIKNQKAIIKNDKLINFYVNIPFCPTRCSYCSFVSSEVSNCFKFIPKYIDALIKEIREVRKLLTDKCYIVKNVYIGGGTPTSLSAQQLDLILSELCFGDVEFTVECGRPDTITKDKLDVLKKYNVNRISINPQTFSNRTLKLIGRNHTYQQTLEAYSMALEYDFNINMDLIAGLPKESFRTFKKSLDITLELNPHNITVHTLAIKNASDLAKSYNPEEDTKEISKMVDYAYARLTEKGYSPYYLYRQKNMLGFFENIGYCKPNTQCKFNIESMEEFNSVIAVGAGGISKRIFSLDNRIERCANVKDINEYINRLDEMIKRKITLFD